jgi:purine nucleosidase
MPSRNPCFDPSILPSVKNWRSRLAFGAVILTVAALPLAHSQEAPTNAGPQLAIIDTDIGDDIDDAFAVALALRSPELHILGITTAYGDTELRARLLDRFLGATGRADIPVAAGVATPHNNVFTQAAYAHQAPQRKHPDAVAFLLDQIRAHPGQITLIAIGPLFNVQAAIERDPVTFRQLRRVVMMGGSIYRGYGGDKNGSPRPPEPEWNIRCDPAGARALLSAGVPVFVMPLDSTQIPLETRAQGAIFSHGSPLTDQLTLLYHQWTGPSESRTPTLFDPVAVTYAIRPDLCQTTPMRLEVDDKGFTRPVQGMPNAQVCLKSDESGFMAVLLDRITSDNPR